MTHVLTNFSFDTIKKIFFSGLITFLPAVLTIAIVAWILKTLESFFGSLLLLMISRQHYFYGLGIFVGLIFVFMLGLLVRFWMIENFYLRIETSLRTMPGIKIIYNAIQDMLGFFDKSKQKNRRAVLIDTPIGRVIGFVTREDLSGLPGGIGTAQDVFVFVPLSFQMGGLTFAMSAKDLIPLDMPVDQAMSMVLTGGMSSAVRDKSDKPDKPDKSDK